MATRRTSIRIAVPGLRNILSDLRKRILDGVLPAGTRLPAVRELAATYGVAGTTIHRCLQELTAAGFLSTHGRNGTRVVDHPPHRSRYGLVLPELPAADGNYHQRHWQAKAVAAQTVSSGPACQIEIFHAINGHPELPEHQRLLTALAECRLAGLIVVDQDRAHEWLVPAELGIPVVGVTLVDRHPAIGNLRLELATFLRQALTAVTTHGSTRPAVLLNTDALSNVRPMKALARQLGLTLESEQILCLPTVAPGWAEHVVASLFSRHAQGRPDALIVADEAALPDIQAAVRQSGADGIFQIHLGNMPLTPLCQRPALRLGWDHRTYLRRAIAMIDAWHSDQRPIGNEELELVAQSASA